MAVSGASGGGGAGAADIRAGKAIVEVGGDANPLDAALKRAKGMIAGTGNLLKGAYTSAVAGVGLGAGFAQVKQTMGDFMDRAADMKKLALTLGTSVEEASKLAYAFKKIGIDSEELAHLGVHLQRSLVEAAQKGEGIFQDLGINAKRLLGKPFEEQMDAVAKAILYLRDPALQMSAAMDIFGKKGFEAVRMFRRGLAESKKECEDLGLVISSDLADRAHDAKTSLKLLGDVFEATMLNVGGALMPAKGSLKDFTDQVKSAGEHVRNFITRNQTAVRVLGALGTGVLAASAALLVLKKSLGLIGAALAIALIPLKIGVAAVTALIGLLPMLLTPLGLIVAGILGMGTAWLTMTKSGEDFRDRVAGLFGNIAKTAKDAWGGIVAAVEAGDLRLAMEIAAKGLQVAWLELTQFLSAEWNNFKNNWMKGLSEMIIAAKAALIAMAGKDKDNIMGAVAGGYTGFRIGRMFGPVGAVIGTAIGVTGGILIEEVAAAKEKLEAELAARGLEKPGPVGNLPAQQTEIERKKQELQDLIDKARRLNQPPPGKPNLNLNEGLVPHGLQIAGMDVGRLLEIVKMQADLAAHRARAAAAARGYVADSVKGGFGVRAGQFEYGDDVQKQSLIQLERIAHNQEIGNKVFKDVKDTLDKAPFFRFK